MKKSLLILLPLFLASCSNSSTGNNIDSEATSESFETYTATIKLSGNEFGTFAREAGKQIDDTSHTTEKESFYTYLSSKLEYESTLSEISCKNLNTAEWETGAALCIGTGYYVNNKFKSGTLSWTSESMIYSVEFKARAYTKHNDYANSLIIDEAAKVQFDDDEAASLYESGLDSVEVKTFSKTYENGVDSFSITSTGARVVLQEIIITWRN